MSEALQIFEFEQNQVRTIISNEGEPWFVAADVCKVLQVGNSRDAVSRLDADEKDVASTDTLGGQQAMTIINEAGLYSLILTSRKPEAKAFKRWVTHDVLPAIRKTGTYQLPADPRAQAVILAHEVLRLDAANKQLEAKIEADAPKLETYEAFLDATNGIPIKAFAKTLDVQPNKLFEHLRQHKVLTRIDAGYVPYHTFRGKGLFLTRQELTRVGVVSQTLLTTRGVEWLYKFLRAHPMSGMKLPEPPQTSLFARS